MTGAERISAAIRQPKRPGPALVAYITAGFPSPKPWLDLYEAVAEIADVVEVGVPFSDPMADGVTLQRTSRAALDKGFTFSWLLEQLGTRHSRTPTLLMGYTNPFLQRGFSRLVKEMEQASLDGFIVPDLPLEEARPLREPADAAGLAVVQLVPPNSTDARMRRLALESTGFTYAVTVTGITGAALSSEVEATLGRVRAVSRAPVCAGFGIRTKEDVARLAPHADGVIVGTALMDAIEKGLDPRKFLEDLKP